MALDLPFSLDHETKAEPVVERGRQSADGERAGIPHRVQQAGSRPQLFESAGAPGQVIAFFAGRMEQEVARFALPGQQGLAMVESLGGNLARMVNPHQAGGMPAGLRTHGGGRGERGRRPDRMRRGKKGPQGVVGGLQQALQGRWGLHDGHYICLCCGRPGA